MMELRIETIPPKKLAGMQMVMSLTANKTRELWQGFMPRRKEIQNNKGSDLFSMQLYDAHYFNHFDPHKEFTKWAAMEVDAFEKIPAGMETFTLPGGLYAVFLYKGAASAGDAIFRYIFQQWLPASAYALDDRPHFEILGEKYRNDDPGSEEEIWIPVKPR